MCQSMANPAVASATAAAQGVLTPQPCTPTISAPWAPPSTVTSVGGVAVATVQSKCVCTLGGEISVASPVQGPAETD
jgi:hypothetical protein